MEQMQATERTDWTPWEEEYRLIFSLIRKRFNYPFTQDPHTVAQNPRLFLDIVELDTDVWLALRPAFMKDNEKREDIDKQLHNLRVKAFNYTNRLYQNKAITANEVLNFFEEEQRVFNEINDMRYIRGIGLLFKRGTTIEEARKYLQKFFVEGGKQA